MKVFTISQINKIIKDLIDNEVVLEDITITGELSSFSITRNIAYFTLKDSDNLLNCVMFNAKTEFNIGESVKCRGNIKYYPKGGKLSFNAISIETTGTGELYQQYIELKNKLEKEGLFSESNKISIPKYIKSIGVVTSKTGAVLQDIRNVSFRRNPNLDIYVYDAQVQGKYASQQIIEGITYFDNYSDVDVIMVARGGGSIEDLMPFNDEELARIAYICNKPIISAVGHETDFTILDFVADLRAPTPSAGAEIVTYDSVAVKRYIKDTINLINHKLEMKFEDLYSLFNINVVNIEKSVNSLVSDEILNINDILKRLDKSIDMAVANTKYRVDVACNTLDILNPVRLLTKGYSIVSKKTNTDKKEIEIGDNVEIITSKNRYDAKITNKEKLNVGTKY